jgi:hypothetical protein
MADLSAYVDYDPENEVIEIFVQANNKTASAITTTDNDAPVPTIVLEKSYDFRDEASPEKETEVIESGFILESELATPSAVLSVINPQDEETLSTQKPMFFGKAPAGKEITIEVESPKYSGTATTGEWGDWNWSPPEDLEPGEHTLTVSYLDGEGSLQKIIRSFVVLAAEDSSLPAFTATPSATPTEESTPTAIPTSPALPTATPAVEPSPTPTTGLGVTPSPTPTSGVTATVPGQEITPGVFGPTFIVFILGVVLLGGGFIWSIFGT